jgi:hypothetical protein
MRRIFCDKTNLCSLLKSISSLIDSTMRRKTGNESLKSSEQITSSPLLTGISAAISSSRPHNNLQLEGSVECASLL